MSQRVTIEEILGASEKDVMLPALSKALGREVSIRIRKIGGSEYFALLPPLPTESNEWPKAAPDATVEERRAIQQQRNELESEWIKKLKPDVLDHRRRTMGDVQYAVTAIASVDPVMTLDQARRLGNDAGDVLEAVLEFSGLVTPEPKSDAA